MVSVRDLGVLGYSATALWAYTTTSDKLSEVLAPGYFRGATEEFESLEWGARRLVSPGDWIMISARDGAAMAWVAKGGQIVPMTTAFEPQLEAA